MNKRKIYGLALIAGAAPCVVAGLCILVNLFIDILKNPCHPPQRIHEAHAVAFIIGLMGLCVLGSGIIIGKTGVSFLTTKQKDSNKAPEATR